MVNADESEPGTCKDREIMRHDPHLFLEGCLIASFAMQAHACYIYHPWRIRAASASTWKRRSSRPTRPSWSARTTSTATTSTCYMHHGGGAYICGEETALLESLEGKKGQPRLKPPFPAGAGLYGCPTTVNNVESIAVVPTILRRGASVVRRLRPSRRTPAPSCSASPGMSNEAVQCRGGHVDPASAS